MKGAAKTLRERLRGRSRRALWFGVILPTVLLLVAAFAVAWHYVDPAPPRKLVMSTGAAGGGYDAIGQAYRALLAREGIELELRASSGAVENLHRLLEPDGDVDFALVQGGSIADEPARQSLLTLGSVTAEGIWVLTRKDAPPLTQLRRLAGKRVAIGAEGSGNRRLAMSLLAAEGVGKGRVRLLATEGRAVIDALARKRIDAAIVVAGVESASLREMLAAPGIAVARLDHAEALATDMTSLRTVRIARGAIDLAGDRPDADLVIPATTANLVVRDSIHPAIVDLLMVTLTQVHSSRSMLAAAGEYPAPRDAELPMHPQATRYYASGQPPLLQKYLPFWVAAWIDRMAVMLVPLLAVVLPLMRVLPAAMQWRIKRRVFRYYGNLSRLEARLDEPLDRAQLAALAGDLDELDHRIAALPVHWYYGDLVYGLRSHMNIVRKALQARLAQPSEAPAAA